MTTPDAESSSAVVVREARPADADAIAAFTHDTWGERHEDYIPRVFPEWAASDDPDSGTFVATLPPEAVAESDAVAERDDRAEGDTLVEGDGAGAVAAGEPEAVVGCIQGVLLSEWEAWGQGIRVDPAARGFGVGTALSTAALDWARDRGARVCRNMVFSWNIMGLGQSRAVGFEPATEFRFAEPEPDASASMGALRPHPSRPSPIPTRTPRGRSGATATPATTCAGSRSTPTSRGPARRSPAGDWRPRPTRIDCSRSPTPTRSPASRSGLA